MILYGASGHAKVIIDILEKRSIDIDFLIDDNSLVNNLLGYEVVHSEKYEAKSSDELIISVGNNWSRRRLVSGLNVSFGWAIHESVQLGDNVKVGSGTVIMACVAINSSTSIGNHCIINTSVSVDHDCELMNYIHISPGATLCGGIRVGEGTQIGAGATLIPNLTVGKWVTIGAGSVIVKDIPDYAVVVGNPGRIIKYNDPEN